MVRRDASTLTIVLSVFERPELLDVVLRALSDQEETPLEVIVADDGSGDEIARVVERHRDRLRMHHVWQPDEGFRKARAMNQAALASRGEFLVFLDADCVPRRGFVGAIRRGALPGWFLTTKRIMLGEAFSRQVVDERLPVWRWSPAEWLVRAPREVRRPGYLVPARDRRRPWRASESEFIPPGFAYCLFGVFRRDFERVNGFEARCVHAADGEDQDLAIRLRRSGLRCGWSGPASTVLHLWHEPAGDRKGGATPLFRETEAIDRVEAVEGLRQLAAEVDGVDVT